MSSQIILDDHRPAGGEAGSLLDHVLPKVGQTTVVISEAGRVHTGILFSCSQCHRHRSNHTTVSLSLAHCSPGHRQKDPRSPEQPERVSPSLPPLLPFGWRGAFTETCKYLEEEFNPTTFLSSCVKKEPCQILPLTKMVPKKRRAVNW